MAGVITPASAKPSVRARLRAFLQDQVAAQTLRWRLWAPVALRVGCVAHSVFESERPLWPLRLVADVATGLWLGARRLCWGRAGTLRLVLRACCGLGLGVAKGGAVAVAAAIAPALSEPTVI